MSMTHKEMIAVIREHEIGKKIQARAKPGENDHKLGWVDVCPNWDFYRCDFRVKPEPREWVLAVTARGLTAFTVEDRQLAIDSAMSRKIIHVREVLE